ncbi:MAG TPA: DUF6118 family protein [Sphingomonas sp.]|jgi:NADH dehydrogenase/NADH:ubiquinone oxidoreductase subunit G
MADGRSGAEIAFEVLTSELAALREEVAALDAQLKEALAAPNKGKKTTDYSPTLREIMNAQEAMAAKVEVLTNSPMLSLTPRQMSDQLAAAAKAVNQKLEDAAKQMEVAAIRAEVSLNSHLKAGEQTIQNLKWGGSSALVAFLLYLAVWGAVVRMTPDSWHWPEWMAARMLGKSGKNMYLEAGGRLISASSPNSWRAMHMGGNLVQENGKRMKACARNARTRGTAQCTVTVDREMAEIFLAGLR